VVDFTQGFVKRTELPTWWVLLKLGIHPQRSTGGKNATAV